MFTQELLCLAVYLNTCIISKTRQKTHWSSSKLEPTMYPEDCHHLPFANKCLNLFEGFNKKITICCTLQYVPFCLGPWMTAKPNHWLKKVIIWWKNVSKAWVMLFFWKQTSCFCTKGKCCLICSKKTDCIWHYRDKKNYLNTSKNFCGISVNTNKYTWTM